MLEPLAAGLDPLQPLGEGHEGGAAVPQLMVRRLQALDVVGVEPGAVPLELRLGDLLVLVEHAEGDVLGAVEHHARQLDVDELDELLGRRDAEVPELARKLLVRTRSGVTARLGEVGDAHAAALVGAELPSEGLAVLERLVRARAPDREPEPRLLRRRERRHPVPGRDHLLLGRPPEGAERVPEQPAVRVERGVLVAVPLAACVELGHLGLEELEALDDLLGAEAARVLLGDAHAGDLGGVPLGDEPLHRAVAREVLHLDDRGRVDGSAPAHRPQRLDPQDEGRGTGLGPLEVDPGRVGRRPGRQPTHGAAHAGRLGTRRRHRTLRPSITTSRGRR